MKKIYILLIAILLLAITSCEDFVTDVDPLADRVKDEQLNDASQLPFLVVGLEHQFTITSDNLLSTADGLSDQLIFGNGVRNATYTTFIDIDKGEILSDNNSIGFYSNIHELRKFADTLLVRVDTRLTNVTTATDTANIKKARYAGHFYSAVAKYYLATYYGKDYTVGGSPLDNGPFVTSDVLYDQALASFTKSLEYATAYQVRLVNSYIARINLFNGDYAEAYQAASQGLVFNDSPFEALYNKVSNNYYWEQMGNFRAQFIPDQRFVSYIDEDPTEAKRIKLQSLGADDRTGQNRPKQVKYPDKDSPLPVMTWQENHLMLAELAVRGHGSANPADLINEVRTSHEVAAINGTIDLEVIYTERDKELFCTGIRLPDQRRFNKWHLGADTWKYFPLTQAEVNGNPNID